MFVHANSLEFGARTSFLNDHSNKFHEEKGETDNKRTSTKRDFIGDFTPKEEEKYDNLLIHRIHHFTNKIGRFIQT